MASISRTCLACGQPFRLVGNGSETVEELRDLVPPVHREGSEGDRGCMAVWRQQEAERLKAEREAEIAAARALIAEVDAAADLCGARVGNGTCVLQAGHSGSHRLYPEEVPA